MKTTAKTIFSLVLLIIFLVACFGLVTVGYFAAWLQTYKAFTDKTLVAEVTISESKKDDKGSYADVKFTPYQTQSALNTLFSQNNQPVKGDSQSYKLYGDTIYVGGPIIKFKDSLILFNFKTIYKLGKIYARYDLDNSLEQARTPDIASSYDINGGYTDWKYLHDNYVSNNIIGDVYRDFIDTTQISSAGMFVDNKPHTYQVFMTTTGFLWQVE